MARKANGPRVNRTAKAAAAQGMVVTEPLLVMPVEPRCTCCGTAYDKFAGNFTITRSPLFAATGGYATICNKCRDDLFDKMTNEMHISDEAACERICALFDLPLCREYLSLIAGERKSETPMGIYTRNVALRRSNARLKTYTETYAESGPGVRPQKDSKDLMLMQTFGEGFKDFEYAEIQQHYDDFVESYGEPEDKSKKEAYIALALLCFRQRREAKSGKDFVALSKAQRDIIDQYHLRALNREEMTTIRPDVDIETIERYCPAEVYENPKLFMDFAGFGKYLKRFFIRPQINMTTGVYTPDPEYDPDDDPAGGSDANVRD